MDFCNDFNMVKNVVRKLSNEDLLHICNGTFEDSPYTKYRLCLVINNESAGFVEIYNLPKDEYEYIVIAITPKYRGNNYSQLLLDKMFKEYKNKYPYLWRCDKDNYKSIKLAKKNKFKLIDETESKYEYLKDK